MTSYLRLSFFISVILFVVLTASSCKEIDEWTKYNMAFDSEQEMDSKEFTTQDSTYELIGNYELNFDKELEKRAVKEKQIERITLEGLDLDLLNNSEQRDFSFIKSFSIKLRGPNFDERILAEGDSIKPNITTLRFTMNQTDGMIDLLKSNEYTIVVSFKLKYPLGRNARFLMTTRFELDARQFFI